MKKVLSILLFLHCALFADDFEAIKAYQKALIEEEITGSNVALVFQDGKVTYHHVQNSGKPGDWDITPSTIFPLFSMSKPVTTVAMMMLYDKGLVDLDDPVSKHLPELADPECRGADGVYECINEQKIIHLLSHRSGYSYYIGSHQLPSTKKHDNLEDFVDAVAELPLEFEPGTQYQYGLNQALLGCVVESITGQSFYEYLKENLFDPVGMKNTKFYVTEEERSNLFQPVYVNSGHLKGFTNNLSWFTFNEDNHAYFGDVGLVSTMADYSKFCQMLLNGGSFEGRKILSSESIKIMTGKHSEGFPQEPRAEPDLVGFYRGFSLFVLEDLEADGVGASKGIYGWQGVANTHFWIDPEKNLFGLFMTRARDFNWDVGKRFRKSVYSSVE
jgi:CubicO group peptidase (beta-lactamase class C family)